MGEYLTLLGDALHDRADELVGGFQSAVAKPAARKVRAMVMSGALTITTARNSRTLVPITVWALESAESLKQRLDGMRAGARANVGEVLRNVRIGADTLEKSAANVFKTLQLDARAARQFAGNAMRSLRTGTRRLGGAAPDLLLSLGSLWFQQDCLRKNLDAIAKAPGAGRDEAIAVAWSSSVGVMGVGVELSGITLKALRPNVTTAIKVSEVGAAGEAAETIKLIPLGARMAQYGGAIGAVAGIMDGVQYAWAADRAADQADGGAKRTYRVAAITSFASAGFGIAGAMALEATLLGPLGIALVLGLAAYAIAQWAKRLESTPLELWARHSLWGLPADRRQWKLVDASNQPLGAAAIQNNYNTAVAALNAAVLGVTAEAAINQAPRVVGIYSDAVALGPALQYAISLPGYDPAAARYSWALVVTRYNGTQVIAAGRNDGAPLKVQAPAKFPDYDVAGAQPIVKVEGDAPGQHALNITGSIELNFNHSVTALAMVVEYWPDKSDEDGYARLTIVQSKLDQTRD